MSGLANHSELSNARKWFESTFKGDVARLPISFNYGGEKSSDILPKWDSKWLEDETKHTLVLTDLASGLEFRTEIISYSDYPAVEWISYFKNTGEADTPIISEIKALDAAWPVEIHKIIPDFPLPCHVHHARGSETRIDDFAPVDTLLRFHDGLSKREMRSQLTIGSYGGRPSSESLPFFDLELHNKGVIGAIGWTGDWKASFNHAKYEMQVVAGMRKTHLKLHPGEEIRQPRMLLLFWEDDRIHGHNMFRRLVLDHYRPTVNGVPAMAPICQGSWGENSCANQIAKARHWKDADIDVDFFWIDAGWHGDAEIMEGSTVMDGRWGAQVGNWRPNKALFPGGLKPIGDALKEMGRGFLLWFEPERVYKDTDFTREHPEWLLGPINDNFLFNLGNSEAREALTNLISGVITEGGLTCYRQDENMDPAPYWEAADAPDRVGISEIRHIEGLYEFWDELRRRHPGLLIDNCAGGGRRLDLEMISRSVALWRSDYQCFLDDYDPIGMQGQTQGLALWVPLSNGVSWKLDTYTFRSGYGPGQTVNPNGDEPTPIPDFPVGRLKALADEEREVSKYFYGDFYPLVGFSLSKDVWAAWQYDRPDLGEGMVLAFRRQNSPFPGLEAKLSGLVEEAQYEVRSLDDGVIVRMSGRELMEQGFSITIEGKPGSALFIYRQCS